METSELSALAKTHVEAILIHNLTKAELVMIVALIQARINQFIIGEAAAVPTNTSLVRATVKEPGAKIAEKGQPCVCVMCAKHIYTISKDVFENTTVKDFIESYTPMPGYKAITRQTKISNIENNITMDCPDCGAELGLYLAGRQIG